METLPDDRTLALQAQQGDSEAYGELVRRYQRSVYNTCYRMMAERRAAEDLTQDAFIRAWERLHLYDAERDFGPWVRRVAANLCLNQLQRNVPVQVPIDAERDALPRSPDSDPALAAERTARYDELRAAILALPDRYRAVVELRHFQELSYAEIAEALEIPMSDVKSHLFRARQRLAELMDTDDD